jgi:hypothetical protein
MSESEFHILLSDFIRTLWASEKEVTAVFEILVQPSSVSFSVQFSPENEKDIPGDIKRIGKTEFRLIGEKVEVFHRSNTANGKNKWNKAKFRIAKFGVVYSEYIWDMELEQREIDACKDHPGFARIKWYWDNK